MLIKQYKAIKNINNQDPVLINDYIYIINYDYFTSLKILSKPYWRYPLKLSYD